MMNWARLQFGASFWKDKASVSLHRGKRIPEKPGINLVDSHSRAQKPSWLQGRLAMLSDHDRPGFSRRKILECMTWAGTGVLWTIAGGMPRSMGLIGEATAAEPSGLTTRMGKDAGLAGQNKTANTCN
jgi:hypothetical protein